ncbi:MAG: alginate export family protein [Parvularcula sp.]
MSVLAAVLLGSSLVPVDPEQEHTQSPLTISGEARVRYETLDGRFRKGFTGSDQALFMRTLIKAELDLKRFVVGGEIQDSRSYLTDEGTPLSSSFVNPADILQAYVRTKDPLHLVGDWDTQAVLGRQTVSIGSKRQIERVSYANVIKSYTGLHATSTNPHGDEFHVLAVVPTGRFPTAKAQLLDNELSGDEEQWGRIIYGLHYRRKDIAPERYGDLWGEVFVYGLKEDDRKNVQTPDRDYVTVGGRLFKAPSKGAWDVDFEGAVRNGSRRASSAPTDTVDLDVHASQLLARVGYTFDAPWQPRVALQYYWASGDDDPNDDKFDQYERLFGGRRTDLNNTSIHGPLTPANLSAPGIRFNIKPTPRVDARLHYSAASLASDTDSFVIAKRRDPTGEAGHFIGHTIDTRARYWVVPKRLVLDVGASAFFHGEVLENAVDPPEKDRTLLGYGQVVWKF